MAKVILIALILMISGCATKPVEPVVKHYTVAPANPVPPFIPRPVLPIDMLKETDEPDMIIKAAKISIKMLQRWGLIQESILNGYRNIDTTPKEKK